MKHGSVYLGGMSRGDTPPRDIPSLGAAGGKPKTSELRLAELNKPCPFYMDEQARFPARYEGMNLDVLSPTDVPSGPLLFPKDYDRSLFTADLDRAQPTLAHPSSSMHMPVPWKFLQMPELAELPGSTSKSHYPPVHKRRPRDLSLTTADIDLAQPKRGGDRRTARDRADCIVDGLTPSYQFMSYEAPRTPEFRNSGRNSLDVSDIDGTKSGPVFPVRNLYGNPTKVETEFRTKGHKAAVVAATREATPRGPASDRFQERRPLSYREGGPLEPRYKVPLSVESAATSLHCRFDSERREFGASPPAYVFEEIGHVEGSKPCTAIRDNGEPLLSLETMDLPGARTRLMVGTVPIAMYGPPGRRPDVSSSLNTADIPGAQVKKLHQMRGEMRGAGSRLAGASIATPRMGSTSLSPAEEATLRPSELGL
mmetsp:Transcript_21365/g.37623  ORF Transcript_21365/g.37623 Transcript_21365/m.37623 type:complete len:425 (-) Transcript_21365:112-1386(-)